MPRAHPRVCGENAFSPDKAILTAAHPRVCGENELLQERWARARGSSPRVRGKRVGNRCVSTWKGLIPACAGKTVCSAFSLVSSKAHPRVCGENRRPWHLVLVTRGSSPRVRGKRLSRSFRGQARGLIPACAGKTCLRSSRLSPAAAHPRVCGENSLRQLCDSSLSGSSPRVRGKLSGDGKQRASRRLIPACAGKTLVVLIDSGG